MKSFFLSVLAVPLMAMGLAAAPLSASAHDGDRRHDRHERHERHGRDDRRDDRRWHDDRRYSDRGRYHGDGRGDWGYRHDRRPPPRVYYPAPPPRVVYHHAPPPRVVYRPYGYSRCRYVRDYYRGPTVVVRDYGRYHVRRPPPGYHWVRDDRGNMLMVAIASGIIADLLLR
ncbi:RcnB family protein [Pseudoxanthomonas composti]|uniref:RcnB family protein n=1 Tax=Pseudoxanthomonas composti TaxID=2137479 RepID=A0A4V1N0R9_9GAMM|nr:RcnB family protein [Pseudoxanthomonas composti]RXR01404.1 hypothetical protein EPA99_15860 [Pseudoxanthomonas composti]